MKHAFVICAYGKSKYLEQCVKSVVGQSIPTTVLMCTSTPSEYISGIATKYGIPLYVREGKNNIKDDWNYAYNLPDADYVTVAHQDDVYHKDYVKYMQKKLRNSNKQDVIMYLTGYRPLKSGRVSFDINCLLRAFLRFPLRFKMLRKSSFVRKCCLAFGNSICCPTVTYNKSKLGQDVFTSDMSFNIDWDTFYKLAQYEGEFVYESKCLTLYRIHDEATSKEFIDNHNRILEDTEMFDKFWPKSIVGILMKFYVKAYDTYS
ncbi:MAG: glycosyltransferase [Lachnospiraceae bacterium]|nr:glycosyltransferase [Lachnospiraceae bacterium]